MKNIKSKLLASIISISTALTLGYTANADLLILKDGTRIYNYENVKQDSKGNRVRTRDGKEIYILDSQIKDHVFIDKDISEETAEKIKQLKAIEDWGEEKLGIPKSDNYMFYDEAFSRYYMVYYCDALRLPKNYWTLGYVRYDKEEDAIKKKKELEAQGYDIFYRTAETLANKSIISKKILERKLSRKVYLVLHENMHDYVNFPLDLDESAANIAGYFGALEYLEEKFGRDSDEYKYVENRIERMYKFQDLVVNYYEKLDKVLESNLSKEEKLKKKSKLLKELAKERSRIGIYEHIELNNASLASFITYSRYDSLSKKVYEKAGTAKKTVEVFKTLSDFVEGKSLNKKDTIEFCKDFLEFYIES